MENSIKSYGVQKSGNGVFVCQYGNQLRVAVVYGGGTFTDFPIKYHNGLIAYDEPFRHKRTTKMMVERAYRFIESTMQEYSF